MKKITVLVAFIGMMALQSCTVNQEPDQIINNTFVAPVFEVTRSFTAANNYSSLITYPASINPIYASDMVLAYRLDGVVGGNDVWKLMPQTFYFSDGTLDFRYDYDFTRYDINIFMDGSDLGTVSPNFRNNQVFRVVIIPADFANRKAIDFKDYNAVVKAFNINESKILKIN